MSSWWVIGNRAVLGGTYNIPLACLPPKYADSEWFRSMTLVPQKSASDPTPSTGFPCYVLTKTHLHMPKFLGIERFGPAGTDMRSHGSPLPSTCAFFGTLRDVQTEAYDAVMPQLMNGSGGALLELPCGMGKTITALRIWVGLGRRGVVLVNSAYLFGQWQAAIAQFVPDARVGSIRGPRVDVDGKDIVVAMLQSVHCRDYGDVLSGFGTAIVDEAHHICARTFASAISKVPAAYVLGLSATPERADGLGHALPWLVGRTAFRAEREHDASVVVRLLTYSRGEEREQATKGGRIQYSRMLTALTEDAVRTRWIAELTVAEAGRGRRVLVLSDRLSHVDALGVEIMHVAQQACPDAMVPLSVGKIVGGSKPAAVEEALQCQVLVSTYRYCAEGFDHPVLDTLVMASPKSDVKQSVGRILRIREGKHPPLVLDVVDNFSVFAGQHWKRRKFYTDEKYRMQHQRDVAAEVEEEEEETNVVVPRCWGQMLI